MTTIHIGGFIAFALLYLWLLPGKWRPAALVAASLVAAFWLQPELPIRWLDFSLTALLIGLIVVVWWVTLPTAARHLQRDDALTLLMMAGIIIFLSLARHIPQIQFLNITSRPPPTEHVMAALVLIAALCWRMRATRNPPPPQDTRLEGAVNTQAGLRGELALMLAIIGMLVLINTDVLAAALSAFLRTQSGQDAAQAKPLDMAWFGFSYVAFRLLHTLRDKQAGILPRMTLGEFVAYGLFFPAFTAGPIDRAEHFLPQFRALRQLQAWDAARIFEAAERIVRGMVKKFVLADTLALFALNDVTAAQAQSSLALWLLLYAYALRLYFDFSGYTDIAIGLGLLFGIRLPENFNAPYLKNNIAAFWQSWHITLSQWVRLYVYTPLSRALLRRNKPLPADLITAICHLTTMLIVGAWHGVAVPFLLWGAWHGVGLVAHKMWSDRTRRAYLQLKKMPRRHRVWTIAGTIITFHFVCLGWVWFALSETAMAWGVLQRLLLLR